MEIAQRDYTFWVPILIESDTENIFITLISDYFEKSIEEVLQVKRNMLAFENELFKRKMSTNHIQNWVLFVPDGVAVKIEWSMKSSLEEIINQI